VLGHCGNDRHRGISRARARARACPGLELFFISEQKEHTLLRSFKVGEAVKREDRHDRPAVFVTWLKSVVCRKGGQIQDE
jgi:hypothetical protein